MSKEKTETSQRKGLGPTEAHSPCPGFFQVFHSTSSSFSIFSLLPSLSPNLFTVPFSSHALRFDKPLRFSRTLLSRYAVFSDYSCLATRRLLHLFLPCLLSPYSCYSLSFSFFWIFLLFGSICLSCFLTCLYHQGQATLRGQHRHLS